MSFRDWFNDFSMLFKLDRSEKFFLLILYVLGVCLRLLPRLSFDPHLLTFQGDVWYRVCMAQYILDHGSLPEPDIRYRAYGYVPMWYPPLSPFLLAFIGWLTGFDLATVCSRILPFLESLSPLTIYFAGRFLGSRWIGVFATLTLTLTPSFVYFTGIADPQSFTLFLIPVVIVVWLRNFEKPSKYNLFFLGLVLALDFIVHLSYFLLIWLLLMVTLAKAFKGECEKRRVLDLLFTILFSQVLTAPWWLPRNLYWWWIFSLVTSSGLYAVKFQLEYYGYVAAALGISSFIYLLLNGKRHLVVLFWAVPPLIESQNEVILEVLGLGQLSWQTLAKPLEGFRFFPFLAQPLSIGVALMLSELLVDRLTLKRLRGNKLNTVISLALTFALIINVLIYNFPLRFGAAGITVDEYRAAVWFREHTGENDRVIADYYRAQMFAGVCGGKAVLGGMFPLRNVEYPYIKAPGRVQDDLYILYNTSNPELAWRIAKQYGATHIFYSTHMMATGNLLSRYKPFYIWGVDVNTDKFNDQKFFETVYKDSSPTGLIVILKVKG